jgi:hypothetical protein
MEIWLWTAFFEFCYEPPLYLKRRKYQNLEDTLLNSWAKLLLARKVESRSRLRRRRRAGGGGSCFAAHISIRVWWTTRPYVHTASNQNRHTVKTQGTAWSNTSHQISSSVQTPVFTQSSLAGGSWTKECWYTDGPCPSDARPRSPCRPGVVPGTTPLVLIQRQTKPGLLILEKYHNQSARDNIYV